MFSRGIIIYNKRGAFDKRNENTIQFLKKFDKTSDIINQNCYKVTAGSKVANSKSQRLSKFLFLSARHPRIL